MCLFAANKYIAFFVPLVAKEKGVILQKQDLKQLCDIIREISFEIHRYHRSGHLEKIYENALVHRLKKNGVKVEQ